MIYTITFSPSIDYVINAKSDFDSNGLNRIDNYELVPGGKGINASVVLKRIGFENKAITFLGSPTKDLFLNLLKNENVDLINIESQNQTRINVKMFANNSSFEINGPRAIISNSQYKELIDIINKMSENDFVFIMGICDENRLEEIVKILHNKSIKFALDIDSSIVLKLTKYKPTIIKPNRFELESLLNKKIKTINEIKTAMKELQDKGIKFVLVSDGKKGSYFIDQNKSCYHIKLNKEFNIVSTVGAGDTLISSFITLFLNSNDLVNSLKQATSLSIGTSMTRFVANKEDLNKYIEFISVSKI